MQRSLQDTGHILKSAREQKQITYREETIKLIQNSNNIRGNSGWNNIFKLMNEFPLLAKM